MNKKISTLVAGILLASGMNGWAQTQIDEAVWPAEAPFVAPYPVSIYEGAKPIANLEKVGTAETRYFQFIADASNLGGIATLCNECPKPDRGRQLVLTMVWKKATFNTPGHYELALENLTNVNDRMGMEDSRVRLDRTLWEVRAKKYPNSPVLYYTLINKASQLPLQLSKNPDPYFYERIKIVDGSVDWLWADGANAGSGDNSVIEPEAGKVLRNVIRAAVDDSNMIYLVWGDNGNVDVISQNSNEPVPDNAITFEAWEANPIVLTADQINAELGYETITTQGKGEKNAFKFTFEPNVEGLDAVNPMTSYTFRAEAPKPVEERVAGDPTDGFVRFQAWEDGKLSGKYLMVDTSYYDSEINTKYDLQMAVKSIEYPKSAVIADGGVVRDGDLYIYGRKIAVNENFFSNIALAQLKRQTNFKPIFYPSTQSLRLQAEMLFKAKKEDLKSGKSWWRQMADKLYSNGSMMIGNDWYDESHVALYWGGNAGYFASFNLGNRYNIYTTMLYYNGPMWSTNAWNRPAVDQSWSFEEWYTGYSNDVHSYTTLAYTNVVKLTSLTNSPKHMVLTCDVVDKYDLDNPDGHDGLLTYISLDGLMPIYTEVADIKPGFYYMQNANTISTDLLKNGEYRYEDLAATAATHAYWNALNETWAVGQANVTNPGEYGYRTAVKGNVVYSTDLKEIPSAQWYINGNGGYYTITNRESRRTWGTSYWWKLDGSNDTYVNHNAYANGTGLTGGLEAYHRDTVRLIPVTDAVLKDVHEGYLNLSAEEAAADTSVFNFRFNTVGYNDLFLGDEGGILKVMKDNPGRYKLERVMDRTDQMVDIVNNSKHYQDSLVYGLNPSGNPGTQLARAIYYIYKDEVSSSSTEGTGVRTRQYITLEGGKYILGKSKVSVDENGYTTYDPSFNNGKADARKFFYVKRISTVDPNQYVLVDPTTVGREMNANGKGAQGVRVFINQVSAEAQPAGLVSQAASNVYDNSVFTIEKVTSYNYRDIRTAGNDRDTLEFFKESNPSISLYENSNVEGSSVGLLDRINSNQAQVNCALFVDTADISNSGKPMFLLGLRPVDKVETSNLPGHNRHLYTTADYLVNMVDSAKAGNDVYKYTNVVQNTELTYYRLGFVPAVHKGSSLYLKNDNNKEIALNGGLTKASFAFRYVDTARDNFYIETIYDGSTPGWVKILNEVPVVTPNIQEAEVYQVKKSKDVPTANDAVSVEKATIQTTYGAVIIKGAMGKNVVISNVLGQVITSMAITSSEVVIPAPAGYVTVSIEGEAAVKAIVK